MVTAKIAGLLLIAGFVFVLIGSFAITPRLWQERDSAKRLEIIAQNQTGWIASNVFWALLAVARGSRAGLTPCWSSTS